MLLLLLLLEAGRIGEVVRWACRVGFDQRHLRSVWGFNRGLSRSDQVDRIPTLLLANFGQF